MSSKTNQVEYWNQSASSKTFSHPLDIGRFQERVVPNAPILDFGCGQGRICGELMRAGYNNLIGADYSAEMIRIAKGQNPTVEFRTVHGECLPFEDETFDVVLLYAVLTCIPDDSVQRQLISELTRVLRQGGLLLVSDYLFQTDPRNVARYDEFAGQFASYGTFRLSDGGIVRHHSEEHIRALLREFDTEDWLAVDSKTMNGNPAKITQIWATKMAR